ncbi:MAG TPA: NADPH-dependent FMN reductase [Nitrososphaeraceae archaeon]|nr:NADPH-dependent FMN reductase [Nitrososphaeraceae archaeon]
MALKILGVGSSMRRNSYGTKALKFILDMTKKYDTETHLLNLRETKLPLFDPDGSTEEDTSLSGELRKITDYVIWADAFVLVSPDYHGSMSGVMKNFLDHYWEEFAGKIFGYMCTSHEKGLTAMDQMRTAIRQCYGWSLPYGVSINGEQDFNTKGEIINDLLVKRLDMLAHDLITYGRLIREQFIKDLSNNVLNTFAARYKVL